MDGKYSQNGTSSLPNGNHSNSDATTETPQREVGCLQKVSNAITGTLENFFESLGKSIGKYPVRFIIGAVVACLLCALGLIAFKEVSDPDDLWVPSNSQVLKDQDWIEENFPSSVTREQILAESNTNILTPEAIAALLNIYETSLTLTSTSGLILSDVCFKAGSQCIVYSILEIWNYSSTTIQSLTQDQIITDINSVTTSPVYGGEIEITSYLGSRTTNSSGYIVSAKAAMMTWLTQGNDSIVSQTEEWEDKFIDMGLAEYANLDKVYVLAGKSWEEESGKAIDSDVTLLSIGYFIVILFVLAVLGKFNLMEQRAWLTLAGFICIGLAILVSIGLSSAFQQGYGPLQSVLPFLLLGIGVDDMFIIMGSLNNLSPEEQKHDIPQKIASVMRHAGVSITVTSFTDFVAFMVGATTIIPALRSFCIYAAVGILALYALQAVFFTACLTLDLRRIEESRDGCCFCCVKHPSPPYKPNDCSQRLLVPQFFRNWLAQAVIKLPFKIVVTVIAVSLLAVNIWGLVELEQYFDRDWFLPEDSYAKEFTAAEERHFPQDGSNGFVYCGNLNYWTRKTHFELLDAGMRDSTVIINGTTDSWFAALTSWFSSTSDTTVTDLLDTDLYPYNESTFISLTYRLTTEEATRTSSYLKFSSSSGSDILASRFPFRHINLDDASSEISAMDDTRAMVKNSGFSTSECFAYSRAYLGWETNKVIREELFRNLGLALLCVFIVTLILIANVRTSLLVFCGVVSTLVDVAGTMHFWGLTVDTVTSIILILSIGLAVDYSAHIGHMFMTVIGSKHDRTKETLGEMGPSVFYGGFSTFLAFILLSNSNSYVFKTFFKVNFLVVLYGLFHGLVFLPVLLSWLGPQPYPTADRVYLQSEQSHSKQGQANPNFEAHENGITNGHALHNLKHPAAVSTESEDNKSTPSTPPPDYSSEPESNGMPSVQT